MIISFRDSINFSSRRPVSFRKHGYFRRITMEQRFSGEKERLLVAMRGKRGEGRKKMLERKLAGIECFASVAFSSKGIR